METQRRYQTGFILALVWTAWLVPALSAATDLNLVGTLREEAREAEKKGQWKKACELYDQILTLDRNLAEIRDRYQICFRHSNLIDRHRDPTFQQQILNRDINFALKVYKEILAKLSLNYFDKDRSDFTGLFQNGLDQLIFALENEVFRNEHLPANTKIADVVLFQAQLKERWGRQAIADPREAASQVFEVALTARKALNLKAVVTVMEFACGACAGLDEYTLYLTPGQIIDAFSSLEGEIIGIGIEIAVRDQHVLITQVLMGSPAGNEGLKPGDWITHIDRRPLDNLPEEIINDRLRGPSGSKIELEVVSMMDMKARNLEVIRELLRFPSVVQAQILPHHQGIGYCRILTFQKNTVQELDDALVELKMQGLKVLILDLRGNRGGLLAPAIQVAERFLAKGKTIVSTQSGVPDQNRLFKANYPDALVIPLVVLVDGETASAAEVVAAALKDNVRATLVGQTTYGKWSIQRVLQLETSGSGVRITLAKLLSPLHEKYNFNGIKPDLAVDKGDQQLEAAIQQAISLAFMRQ